MHAVANRDSVSAVAKFERRHAVDIDEQLVQTARARESRVERDRQHLVVRDQSRFHVLGGQHLQESFRTDACPATEHPLQMKRAHADRRREIVERRLLAKVCVEIRDGALDAIVFGGAHSALAMISSTAGVIISVCAARSRSAKASWIARASSAVIRPISTRRFTPTATNVFGHCQTKLRGVMTSTIGRTL